MCTINTEPLRQLSFNFETVSVHHQLIPAVLSNKAIKKVLGKKPLEFRSFASFFFGFDMHEVLSNCECCYSMFIRQFLPTLEYATIQYFHPI